MSEQKYPDWFPKNPYFPSVFTMSMDDVVRALPDDKIRTGVAGKLMHDAWELAAEALVQALNNHKALRCDSRCQGHPLDPEMPGGHGQCVRPYGHEESHLAMNSNGGCRWEDQ